MTWLLLAAAALGQDYMFPTSAADYGHFYPTAYYDHGGADWNCGSIRYGGHRGNDFGVGSWAGMDAGRDILAAAPGTVVATHDGEFDRCTSGTCGTSNYVIVQHADGKQTVYVHMKTWSVAVSVGQQVQCGTFLGLVGSSGNSTGPHLHFAVRVNGSDYDPFDGPCSAPPSWWVSQGAYAGRPGRQCEVVDNCPSDPNKTEPGICGCGVPDVDSDGDGAYDCQESCDSDPNKTSPGVCGCGTPDSDSDGDGALDCQETCDSDPNKTSPGVCGCGTPDVDADGDGAYACQEACDDDPDKLDPGVCGCGTPDTDGDGDGTADCLDACPLDPGKTEPGDCGCGTPDEDITGDGIADCTTCGDGVVQAPEQCDDAGRTAGDGCDALCQVEALGLVPPDPGQAGVPNQVVITGVPAGRQALLVASARLGSTQLPGCPVTLGLQRPRILGVATGDASGTATIALNVPASVAGRSFAMVAVDLSGCRVTPMSLVTFSP